MIKRELLIEILSYHDGLKIEIVADLILDEIEKSNAPYKAGRGVGAVPAGWKLVPEEPTNRMTFLGQSVRYDSAWSIGAIYRHMLEATPTPPLSPDSTGQKPRPLV